MQLGIFAKTFAGQDPTTVLNAAKNAGFSCVQYNMACSGLGPMPDSISADVNKAIKAASHDVKIVAVSGTYNMISPLVLTRGFGMARLQVLAKACSAMGTKMITLCTGTRDTQDQWRHHPDNRSNEAWRDLCVEMAKALKMAEKNKVILGIEPELGNVVNSAAKARQLLDEMQSDNLKIVFDAANLFEVCSLDDQRHIVASSIDILAGDIVMAHAKDRNAQGGFTAAGKGVLDYEFYLHCLKAIDFQGPLVTHGLSTDEAPQVAHFLKEKRNGLD